MDLTTNKYFNFKLFGPPRPIYLSFQDGNSNEILAYNSVLSSNNQWQQFTVDLSSVSTQNIERFVLFLDQSVVNWDTYYLDDFHLSSVPLGPLSSNFFDLRGNIKLYPQPARNVVTIEADKLISSLTISDISGRILLKNDFAQQVKQHIIDISFLNEEFIL